MTLRYETDPTATAQKERESAPRTTAADSTEPLATVPADRRRAIASKSWLLAPDLPEPRVYASTIPAGYRGGR